jgi:glucosamine--fructose-6-phosphate aminotransferase (isomerizing)
MSDNGSLMRAEIAQIPSIFQKLADRADAITAQVEKLPLDSFDSVILLARGTSDNAALYLKYLIETKIGIPCGLASPSVVTVYQSKLKLKNCLVIALSQSGQSPDLISYAEAAKNGGAKVLALTNEANSPLAKAADLHLYLEAGEEKAVAATKSYSAELLLSLLVVSTWAKEVIDFASLVSEANRAVSNIDSVSKIVDNFDHTFGITTLGRGFSYANAHETALKIQETLKIPVSSFSSADYLHGPISSLHENSRVIFLAPTGVSITGMAATVTRIREITPHIYWIGNGFEIKPGEISLGGAKLSETLAVIADSIVLQQFAMLLAIKNGLNPDAPIGLLKVTKTK